MSTPYGYYIATQLPAPAFGVALRRMDDGVEDVQPGEVAFSTYPTNAQLTASGFTLALTQIATMQAIATQIFALSTSQKANIVTALYGGSSPLFNQGDRAMAALQAAVTGPTGAPSWANQAQQLIGAAMYVQLQPGWLINPAFDPTISVSGYVS